MVRRRKKGRSRFARRRPTERDASRVRTDCTRGQGVATLGRRFPVADASAARSASDARSAAASARSAAAALVVVVVVVVVVFARVVAVAAVGFMTPAK
jgi:hypothetical protein